MIIFLAGGPTFGYSHPLKTMFKKGQLDIPKGFYGDKLTAKNVSLEHLKPVSKGGKTEFSNLVLASKQANGLRGNQPLSKYFNPKAFLEYAQAFVKIKTKTFDGKKYIEAIAQTIQDLLRRGE